MCKLFNEHRVLERIASGELGCRTEKKLKSRPWTDRHGNLLTQTELLTVWDKSKEEGDPFRDVALEVNRHLTEGGTVGASGKWDPSSGELQINGIIYRKFKTTKGRIPTCQMCDAGDTVEKRFEESTFQPNTGVE